MKIERIGMSLGSIAEERNRQHREHPDQPLEGLPAPETIDEDEHAPPSPTNPPGLITAADHIDDPTARLRLEPLEPHAHPSRDRAVKAFDYDEPAATQLPPTEL